MVKLLLRFSIHLDNYDLKISPNGPLFHRYLPDGRNDELVLETGDPHFVLKVWFERRGFVSNGMIEFDYSKKDIDPEVIPKQGILDGGPLSGLAEIDNLSESELTLVREKKIGEPEFIKLGKKIVQTIEPPVNNLFNILRIKYGQYWISNFPVFDSRHTSVGGYCNSLQMQWSLDDGINWDDFIPDQPTLHFTSTIGGNFDYYLSKNDWDEIKIMAKKEYDPSVAATSLSQAYHYMDQDHLKHAIIEGVTSLELAMEEFFQSKLSGNDSLLEKLGEFRQLHMPTKTTMICTAIGIPIKDIEESLEIIKIRNDIAHNGIGPATDVKRKLFTVLNIVSILIFNKKYRFPAANHGNAIKSVEQWDEKKHKV